jgi:hypothetical protein
MPDSLWRYVVNLRAHPFHPARGIRTRKKAVAAKTSD